MTTWLKIDAACAYCGGVSRRTLYDAVKAGKLRVTRIGAGRNVLFNTTWLDAWLVATADAPVDKDAAR